MSTLEMTLNEQGHLFGVWTGVGRPWCLGCGCRTDSARGSAPCPEAEEMAADLAAGGGLAGLETSSV